MRLRSCRMRINFTFISQKPFLVLVKEVVTAGVKLSKKPTLAVTLICVNVMKHNNVSETQISNMSCSNRGRNDLTSESQTIQKDVLLTLMQCVSKLCQL